MEHNLQIETRPISYLRPDPNNARKHDAKNIDAIAKSLARFGQRKPIVIVGDGTIVAGNGTVAAAKQLGWTEMVCARIPYDWTADEVKAYALADNRTAELAEWDSTLLAEQLLELDAEGWDVSDLGFQALHPPIDGQPYDSTATLALADRFLEPPFSVLEGRSGRWQSRKKTWLDLGLDTSDGRLEQATLGALASRVPDYYDQKAAAEKQVGSALAAKDFEENFLIIPENAKSLQKNGTSVFDPVVCEIAYRWFSPIGGQVFDPFAGGAVRGVVASVLMRKYTGIDLRLEQIAANKKQWPSIKLKLKDTCPEPEWIVGDSTKLNELLPQDFEADLIFSCPPYADLEKYSVDPADISNMSYKQFLQVYEDIIKKSIAKLKNDRFAVWVIGDVREPKNGGAYRGLVGATIQAFEKAGARFYNEAILVTPLGALRITAGRPFLTSRKLGKTHQQVLVFVKGDPKKASEACGLIEIPDEVWDENDIGTIND